MSSYKQKIIEVLAPAGSVDSMKAAFHAGADAVYMGGSRFGARAFADNPEEEELKKAIDYAHIHGKKLYLTMNTLMKDRELEEEAYTFLKPYYEEGLDGIIIQDLGLMTLLKECFPKLPLHGSTQMTITGTDMAKWLERQGLERIVLSRELSLDEIHNIRKQTDLELEVFVQGALCYCNSGQCLMSRFIGGRSGNRGRCAQPCRLPYQVEDARQSDYILSPKDICTLNDIPNLVDAGADSFKIEGRMKKPEYAALTAWLYRHYVDQYLTYGKDKFKVDSKDVERLMDLYNRGGFSGGYLHQHNHAQMIFRERPNHMGVPVGNVRKKNDVRTGIDLHTGDVLEIRSKDGKSEHQWTLTKDISRGETIQVPIDSKVKKGICMESERMIYRVRNQKLIDELHKEYLNRDLKEKICGTLYVCQKHPVCLNLNWKDISVSVEGSPVEMAKNQPMTEEQFKKPILKTGNTPFVFEKLDVSIEGNCYIPNSQLNELRRKGLEQLESGYLNTFFRFDAKESIMNPELQRQTVMDHAMALHVMLSGMDTLKNGHVLNDYESVKRVYVELHEAIADDFYMVRKLKSAGKEIYFALPSIFREKDREKIISYLYRAKSEADGWLVRQMELALLLRKEFPNDAMILDASVYNMNGRAKRFLKAHTNSMLTAPVELNYSELKALGCSDVELIVYGHQSLMVSAQCIIKNQSGCKKQPKMVQLTDRQHKHFYVYNECEFCYNKIYNGLPTILFDKKKELIQLNPASLRMHFTMESAIEMRHILDTYEAIWDDRWSGKTILKEFTRGHFTRGIE